MTIFKHIGLSSSLLRSHYSGFLEGLWKFVIKFNQTVVEIQSPARLVRRTEYDYLLQAEKLFYLRVVNNFLQLTVTRLVKIP